MMPSQDPTQQQMALQALIGPEEGMGFGVGTPQYEAYRAMVDRGEQLMRGSDPGRGGILGTSTDAFKFAALAAATAGLGSGAFTAGSMAAAAPAAEAGLSEVALPASATYLAPIAGGSSAVPAGMAAADSAGAAAVGPSSELAGSAVSMAPEGGGSSGGSNFLQRLFHMGGNLAKGGGQQRQPYHYQNPAVADYAQQQQSAEMLAEALSKRQPVDPVVRGGPTPVSPFGQQRY